MNKEYLSEFESVITRTIKEQKTTNIYIILSNGHIYEHCKVKDINTKTKRILFKTCYINTQINGEYLSDVNIDYSTLEAYSVENLN
jgi:hypothetical protein